MDAYNYIFFYSFPLVNFLFPLLSIPLPSLSPFHFLRPYLSPFSFTSFFLPFSFPFPSLFLPFSFPFSSHFSFPFSFPFPTLFPAPLCSYISVPYGEQTLFFKKKSTTDKLFFRRPEGMLRRLLEPSRQWRGWIYLR